MISGLHSAALPLDDSQLNAEVTLSFTWSGYGEDSQWSLDASRKQAGTNFGVLSVVDSVMTHEATLG